jgi:hypothetical protein
VIELCYKFKSPELKQAIAACLPDKTMRMALTHALPTIRWVAFQSLESVVASYSHTTIEGEASLWRYAFPYSVKTTESKEYTASILQCLSTFLDRFSVWEVAVVEENRKNQPNSESRTGNSIVLPNLHTFIVEFLIKDVFMKKGAYPGTVADKEGFSLALLECILTFAIQDQSYSGDNCVLKSGVIFRKRHNDGSVASAPPSRSDCSFVRPSSFHMGQHTVSCISFPLKTCDCRTVQDVASTKRISRYNRAHCFASSRCVPRIFTSAT